MGRQLAIRQLNGSMVTVCLTIWNTENIQNNTDSERFVGNGNSNGILLLSNCNVNGPCAVSGKKIVE